MLTPREQFDRDSSQHLRYHTTHAITNTRDGTTVEVTVAICLDFEAGSIFGYLFIPESSLVTHAIVHYLSDISKVTRLAKDVEVVQGFAETDERISSDEMSFSGRLSVYTPHVFSSDEKRKLANIAKRHDIRLVIRDGSYLTAKAATEVPLAFISHDFRDKVPFVRDLAATLQRMLSPVWYDEYSLVAGQSLRASIEKGLRECRKCVLILSPYFLSNNGWTRAEFDSIFTREILEKENVMIPVWHGVTKEQVYSYSPRLLDKIGIPSSLGVEQVANRILQAIRHNPKL